MEKDHVSVPYMRCSIQAREKPKANQKDNKAITNIPLLPSGQKEKESNIQSLSPSKDNKGKAIPQKRQAFQRRKPMKANGWNLPIIHLMTPGKLTVPHGTGMQKLTGKKLKSITRTGRRLRSGNIQQVGFATVLQLKDSREDLLSRVSGLLCRASGQDDDYSQLFVEDVTGHCS